LGYDSFLFSELIITGRGAEIALVVYDISKKESFLAAQDW
jgi:hypothetical protein